jgi:predicted ribosomally synthesized peptide with SipW-like signal peptide
MSATRVVALTLSLVLACGTLAVGRSGTTEAAWTDRVHTRGTFTAGRWGMTGSAQARALRATLYVTTPTTPPANQAAPVGPASQAAASQSAWGPATSTAASVTLPAMAAGGLSGTTILATTLRTHAQYDPAFANADTSLQTARVGLNLLGLLTLSDLWGLSSVATNQRVASAVTCPSTGASTATTTALTDLRLTLLGSPATMTVNGNTATASAQQTALLDLGRTTVTSVITRAVSTASYPADPTASADLVATVTVQLEQRSILIGPWSVTNLATFTIPLVTSTCTLDLP